MKISEAFPSNYLKVVDLGGQPRIGIVRACVLEELGQGNDKQKKPVLYFKKKPVELFSTQVQFKSEMVDAIRVRIPKAEQPAAEAAPMADDELNDEIPDW
jgi:hypothetical protein